MKKIFSSLLVFSVMLSLCACGRKPVNEPQNAPAATEETVEVPVIEDKKEESRYVAYKSDGKSNDLLTVEEVVLMPEYFPDGDYYCTWKVKVKNTTGADLVMGESGMKIWYSYLDENGNVMYDGNIISGYSDKGEMSETNDTIKSFMSEWIKESGRPAGWTKEESARMKTIKIYGYCIDLGSGPDYEFEEPIIINLSDYFEWE